MESFLYRLMVLGVLTVCNADSSEENPHFAYNVALAPPAQDFKDIYPHGTPEESSTSDEDVPTTQFVEVPKRIQPITSTEVSSNITVLHNSSFIDVTTQNTITFSSSHRLDGVPKQRVKHQRGVLDLLLPPPRVRTFKSIFDTFRRMLSYTFRK